MLKPFLWGVGLALLSITVRAQSVGSELANMREDVRLLNQKVGSLSLKIEELERQNESLAKQVAASSAQLPTSATVQQLNAAVADLNQAIKAGDAATAASAAAQIKKLGDATNIALDSLAKGQAARAPVQTTFSESFPSEGISYTVQKGDTLSTISRNTGAKLSDIINANKIADPTKVRVGDILFIPGGK
ncbi:LysM peptidoglycan-binding domain-containing protein [Rariglobus hedericola]|uniref:LysM peptidoglycan-binding domain-containing protein n=1 Tax=Rariglobus hedericola TaxID=2597822 RepID=A0A556QN10_9BACT|nr:LysM domain-containing protein [Rariglobus hedericola]TSJ78024.1 LysM peptidoglycan-binding domain-containing protein [Rariglobus hedericola]